MLWGVLAAGAAVAFQFVDSAYDDAFITYRYARNLAEGHGFVYNLEHNFLGTTTPLYTLMLGLAGVAFDIPRVSGLISVTSLLGCVVLIELLGRQRGIRFAGSAAGLFLLFEPRVYGIFGGETLLAQLLLLPLGLLLDLRGRSGLGAFVFGLAILARMDSGVFVAIVYATWIVRDRSLPWRRVGIVAATLLPWFAWSWWYFGTPFPSTLAAKIAMGQSGLALYIGGSLKDLGALIPYESPAGPVFFGLAVLGLARMMRREPLWLLFLANSLVFAGAYQWVLGSAYSHWYIANALVTHALLLGAGTRTLALSLLSLRSEPASREHRPRGWSAWGRPAVIGLAGLIVFVALVERGVAAARGLGNIETRPPRRAIYTEVGEWLRDNTPEEATVSYLEIGYLGYASRRTIIDPMGLVTPGGLEATAKGDFDWVFDRYKPDYAIDNPAYRARALGDFPWFRSRYALIHEASVRGYPGKLRIFERRDRLGGP